MTGRDRGTTRRSYSGAIPRGAPAPGACFAIPLLFIGLAFHGSPVAAQAGGAAEGEVERLQEASQREARGELDEAERLLRKVLEERSASVPAILALERVLRIGGRLDELVPLARAALAEDPRSALLNQILLRTYSALDRVDDLEDAADAWIETVPRIEIAYREVARVWESRGEVRRALAVLEEGRRRLERDNALALELGDLHAAVGDPERAVAEWSRAIDERGRGLRQVRRRLLSLPDEGAGVAGVLIDLLAADGSSTGRMEAALELALDAGLEDRARAIAETLLPLLAPQARHHRLGDVARRADAAGHPRLAYWAYDRLLSLERDAVEGSGRLLALRNRVAELALELGDTARASDSYREVEQAFDAGSPERRRAAAARIELAANQDPDEARDALVRFRDEYPDVDEADRLTAVVARSLIAADRASDAELLLADARGPRSGMLRARLMLEGGDVDGARRAYMTAATELRGAEATAVLSVVTLLGRISDRAGSVVGEAMALRDQDRAGEAVDLVAAEVERLEPGDQPPLLDFVAGLADGAGLVQDARSIRRRIVEDHPRSREAPAALLALGRDLSGEPGSRGEARELLERLIIEYPRSALVPQARRALDVLARGGVA